MSVHAYRSQHMFEGHDTTLGVLCLFCCSFLLPLTWWFKNFWWFPCLHLSSCVRHAGIANIYDNIRPASCLFWSSCMYNESFIHWVIFWTILNILTSTVQYSVESRSSFSQNAPCSFLWSVFYHARKNIKLSRHIAVKNILELERGLVDKNTWHARLAT